MDGKRDEMSNQSHADANYDSAIITISKLAALDTVLHDPKLLLVRSEVL